MVDIERIAKIVKEEVGKLTDKKDNSEIFMYICNTGFTPLL